LPAIQGRTKVQLRTAVGTNLGLVESTTTSGVDASSVVDTAQLGDTDEHKGKWIVPTSGSASGEIRRVSTNDTAVDFSTSSAFSASIASGVTYQLWPEDYNPAGVNNFLDQAIMSLTGRAFDPVEDVTHHTDNQTTRFDIPATLDMISRIEYRSKVDTKRILTFNALMDETTDAEFTQSLDTEDTKFGDSSLKVTISASASANDIISDSITSLDISRMTHIEGWIKSSITMAAGDLQVLLDDTGAVASPVESLNIPAVGTADQWQHFRIALTAPESLTAIISVGIKYITDSAAQTIWLSDLRATNQNSSTWSRLRPDVHWRIDKEARDLVLTGAGKSEAGYALLKISGGDLPTLFTDETTVNEVDDEFVINFATGRAFVSAAGQNSGARQTELLRLATFWEGLAARARVKIPTLSGRLVA
jgi:hypothetical protein